MTQFHQEEQKRLKEECKKGYGKWSTACTHIELNPFLTASNSRVMKHILEELLAEIPEAESMINPKTGMEYYRPENIAQVNATNAERLRQTIAIAKKLSDIALEE